MTNDMNDKPQIKLSETVVLIDAAFHNSQVRNAIS